MELFHGFETKVTVEEMQDKHGEPSRVYDARKVSRVEGYDVWEYDIQFGKIECYVKKDDKVVDYIFRKFSEPRSLRQIVTDGQVARNLMADKKRVDYLSDDFKNTLVFFKQDASASSDLIASIALDVDIPMPDEPLRSKIETYRKTLPLALAVSCRMTSLSYKHHVVSIVCEVLGSSSDDIIARMKTDHGFGYQFALFLFGDKGVFSDMRAKLQEEKADIKLTFKSENSKAKTVFKINAGALLKSQTTARQRLKAIVAIYSMRLMNLDYYKSERKMELLDNVVYLLNTCEGSFKTQFKDCTLDNDSYYQDLLMTCAQSGVGLQFVFTCTDSETEMSYSNRYIGHKKQNNSIERYNNDDLKRMRAEIK